MGQAAVMVPRLDSRIFCRPVAHPDAPASFACGPGSFRHAKFSVTGHLG